MTRRCLKITRRLVTIGKMGGRERDEEIIIKRGDYIKMIKFLNLTSCSFKLS